MTAPLELSVRCPACSAVFSLDLPQLQRRKGVARCVRCAHIFDAYEAVEPTDAGDHTPPPAPARPAHVAAPTPAPVSPRLRDEPRIGLSPTPMRGPASPAAPPLGPPVPRPNPPVGHAGPVVPAVIRPPSAVPPIVPVRDDDEPGDVIRVMHEPDDGPPTDYDAPIYLDPRERPDEPDDEDDESPAPYGYDDEPVSRAGLWRGVVAVLLALLLVGQLVYVYRAQVADRLPVLRPLLAGACEALGCQLPHARRIDRIAIMRSALNSLPAQADQPGQAMRLALTLRNEYEQAQEWPTLVLDLTDASGTRVVSMQLPPARYLSPDVLAGPFPPVSEVEVAIDMRVDDVRVNGFQLDKFFP